MTRNAGLRSSQRPLARFLALVVLVSVAAPSAAFCSPGASPVMPCCAKRDAGAPPVLRPCCGPTAPVPATPRASIATAVHPPNATPVFLYVASTWSSRSTVSSARRADGVQPRLLNSVFLI
jgi:hypothetical protein